MNMNIGGNIRRLRLAKGLTQEQLAEVFGVSPQAVSRWENDSAYPDITLLPGMAMYFGVSTDELIGMDVIRREERLFAIHGEINRLVVAGDSAGAAKLIKDSLRLFPGDSGLIMSLAETLAHMDDADSLEEAVRAGEKALTCPDITMKARSTAAVNLIFLCLKTGRDERAKELIRSLPHIWEAREMLMPEVYDGPEYDDALRLSVKKALVFLYGRIKAADDRRRGDVPEYVQLGVDFDAENDVRKMLDAIAGFFS